MTSEGLREMFEDDSADMCAAKFLLILMGGQVEGQTRERGPPSGRAEFFTVFTLQKSCFSVQIHVLWMLLFHNIIVSFVCCGILFCWLCACCCVIYI
jgi:hypothetical protein